MHRLGGPDKSSCKYKSEPDRPMEFNASVRNFYEYINKR